MSVEWTEQRLRKALKQMANDHESAAVEAMHVVERANDSKLAQRLLEVIEQMHRDVDALRSTDGEIANDVIRCQWGRRRSTIQDLPVEVSAPGQFASFGREVAPWAVFQRTV